MTEDVKANDPVTPATPATQGEVAPAPDTPTTPETPVVESPATPDAPATPGTPAAPGTPEFGVRSPDQPELPPRRVRGGFRLRSRDKIHDDHHIARRFRALLETGADEDAIEAGYRYAKSGQTTALEWLPGELAARVQGHAPHAYRIRVDIGAFDPETWDSILHAMAAEAVHSIKVQEGEVPEEIDDLLGRQDLAILPTSCEVTCTCERPKPCRHLVAVALIAAEHLAAEPLKVFTVRGMPIARLRTRLRQTRAIRARGTVPAHPEPPILSFDDAPEGDALAAAEKGGTTFDAATDSGSGDSFWRPGPAFWQFLSTPPPHHMEHALLRRLGPSPLGGAFPLAGLLASVYDEVGQRARTLLDVIDGEDTSPPPPPDDEDGDDDE